MFCVVLCVVRCEMLGCLSVNLASAMTLVLAGSAKKINITNVRKKKAIATNRLTCILG